MSVIGEISAFAWDPASGTQGQALIDLLRGAGWIACEGQSVSASAPNGLPDLFAAIGTTWGGSADRSAFNVPDLRGQFLSLTLADLRGVGERVFHTMPDMARNFDAVTAGP
jgi:hypothetical protein